MSRKPIRESVTIHAPIERCWALSTRIELVQKTLGMTPVAGVTNGFVQAGSRVTWSGWKVGLPTKHHTLITAFVPPHAGAGTAHEKEAFFQDTQEKGRFAEFHHDHFFCEKAAGDDSPVTTLADEVHYRLPFGFLGELVARFVMQPMIRRLVRRRFAMLKELAEGEGWRSWMG